MRRSFATVAPRILFQHLGDLGSGTYRMKLPASLLRRHSYAITLAHPHPVSSRALEVMDPDAIVFQMFQTQEQIERIRAYRKAVPKAFFVYEIDDLFWAVPEGTWHSPELALRPHAKSNIRTAAKFCDAIVCSTPELASEMRKLTGMKDVRVAPNYVDRAFINGALTGRRSSEAAQGEKPRIGWAGGVGHSSDLRVLDDVIQHFGDRVEWRFLGFGTPKSIDVLNQRPGGLEEWKRNPHWDEVLPGVSIHPGCPFHEYARELGKLNLDIALAPLEDNDFNRCKSNLRVLEYAAAGFPVIASDITPYRSCPVPLVGGTADAWINAIEAMLMTSREARLNLGETLHDWVLTQHMLENHLAEREAAYLPKDADTFIPNIATKAVGSLVVVGTSISGLASYDSIPAAWDAAPGAAILVVRPGTEIEASHVHRLVDALGKHASATALSNDCCFPQPGQFHAADWEFTHQVDLAARLVASAPIDCPYPVGPCTLLAGPALSRFGLPDESRFATVDYALADWGARVLESGFRHVTVTDTYVAADQPLMQAETVARRTIDQISIWSPSFPTTTQAYRASAALAETREDLELAYQRLNHAAPAVNSYAAWYRTFCALTEFDREQINTFVAAWDTKPHFNIVMPVYDPDPVHLRAALDSVLDQTYTHWDLLICDDASTKPAVVDIIRAAVRQDERVHVVWREKNGHICEASNDALKLARDGWVCFLDHDDALAPHALYLFADKIRKNPEAQFIYSDSDKISVEGELCDPYFAPDFSYELLLAQNYVCHMCAYRLDTVKQIGGLQAGMEGSQDWDLTLRYLEDTCGVPPNAKLIRHIPQALYHWRASPRSTSGDAMAKPYAITAGRKAVTAHLSRTKQLAHIAPHPVIPTFSQVRFMLPDPVPSVTIVIPTADNHDQLDRCLQSVLQKTIYPNFTITVMDNGRKRVPTITDKRVQVIVWNEPFNYSTINNFAVEKSKAEFVCLLNDDTEVIEQAWLLDMVALAERKGVGAVGAKMVTPDGRVQHGGVMVSAYAPRGQRAIHMWQGLPPYDVGQVGRAVITQPVAAVTGACLVIRRNLYQEIDGLDPVFPVDYNDIDFCLRLHDKGYRNIVTGQVMMMHDAGSTKKRKASWRHDQMMVAERQLFERWPDFLDPYVNPNLMFSPHLRSLVPLPHAKPWLSEQRLPVLLVNPGQDDLEAAFLAGELPFAASMEGHYLMFTRPNMPNVRPIDLREPVQPMVEVLEKLGTTAIIFCGIGDGTLGGVGFFAALAEIGWPVRCKQGAEQGNVYGYYDQAGWGATWDRLVHPRHEFTETGQNATVGALQL